MILQKQFLIIPQNLKFQTEIFGDALIAGLLGIHLICLGTKIQGVLSNDKP